MPWLRIEPAASRSQVDHHHHCATCLKSRRTQPITRHDVPSTACSPQRSNKQLTHTCVPAGLMPALAAALTALHAAAKRQAPKPLDPSTHELAVSLLTLWNPLMVAMQSTEAALICPLVGTTLAPASNLAAAILRSWQVRFFVSPCKAQLNTPAVLGIALQSMPDSAVCK
jgi:hypothetical protein